MKKKQVRFNLDNNKTYYYPSYKKELKPSYIIYIYLALYIIFTILILKLLL